MGSRYFEIGRDKHFAYFCQACLVGKVEAEMSKNEKLCIECQSYITEEYTLRHPESLSKCDTGCNKTNAEGNHREKAKKVLLHAKQNAGW